MFVLLGPPLGFAIFGVLTLGLQGVGVSLLLLFPPAALLTYLVGGPPAFCAGIVAAVAAYRGSRRLYLLAPIVGAAAALWPAFARNSGEPSDWRLFGAVGGLSGLVLTLPLLRPWGLDAAWAALPLPPVVRRATAGDVLICAVFAGCIVLAATLLVPDMLSR